MIARVSPTAARVTREVLVAAIAVAIAITVGFTSVGHIEIAVILAAAVLVAGLVISNPLLLVALAAASTLLMQRIGGALSISDAALALATVLAIFFLRGQGLKSMSTVLWAGVAYLAAILPTTILYPYAANITEWAHQLVLVLGSLVVGFVIGRSGRTRLAIGLYVVACSAIAVVTVIAGVVMLGTEGRFGPVYLPSLDKNLIGCALAATVIIVYGRPAWFRLSPKVRWTVVVVCGLGVGAAGSRQAAIGLAVGLLVIALRRHPETGRHPKLPWISFVLIVWGVVGLVTDQLSTGDQFNSSAQRLNWYADSVRVWETSPILGVGLRWWYTNRFGVNFQPPNLELEQLTTVGIVGLVALLALFVVTVVGLWRLDPWYGTVGVAIVVARFTESQFDLHWVAGQASFLWIITGICFGAMQLSRHRGEFGERVESIPAFRAPRRPLPRRVPIPRVVASTSVTPKG